MHSSVSATPLRCCRRCPGASCRALLTTVNGSGRHGDHFRSQLSGCAVAHVVADQTARAVAGLSHDPALGGAAFGGREHETASQRVARVPRRVETRTCRGAFHHEGDGSVAEAPRPHVTVPVDGAEQRSALEITDAGPRPPCRHRTQTRARAERQHDRASSDAHAQTPSGGFHVADVEGDELRPSQPAPEAEQHEGAVAARRPRLPAVPETSPRGRRRSVARWAGSGLAGRARCATPPPARRRLASEVRATRRGGHRQWRRPGAGRWRPCASPPARPRRRRPSSHLQAAPGAAAPGTSLRNGPSRLDKRAPCWVRDPSRDPSPHFR